MKYFIADNLKFLRNLNELTQEELASIVNYSFRTVSKWETGEAIPSYENLQIISKTFNVSIDDLMRKDLSIAKDFHKYSSKIIENKNNFLLLQSEIYKFLYTKSDNENVKRIKYKNYTIMPYDFKFSDRINIILKKEKLSFEKAKYILFETLDEMRKNGLIDYFEITENDCDEFSIKYKLCL